MEQEVVSILMKLIEAGPEVFDGVEKIVPIAADLISKIRSPTPPTAEEWTALHDKIDEAREELDSPFDPME